MHREDTAVHFRNYTVRKHTMCTKCVDFNVKRVTRRLWIVHYKPIYTFNQYEFLSYLGNLSKYIQQFDATLWQGTKNRRTNEQNFTERNPRQKKGRGRGERNNYISRDIGQVLNQ